MLTGDGHPLPPVTVLLPVYNAGPHLAEAVASILTQTHSDFELVAVDDGSTDDSGDYLDSLDDPRVRVVHQANQGLVGALNVGISHARNEFIARMDQDDISAPERLAAQAAELVRRPGLAALASCFGLMSEDGRLIGDVHLPVDEGYLARQLYFRNVLPHGGMMFRKSLVLGVGGYRAVGPAEDYDLWTRLAVSHSVGSLPTPLFRYRVTASGMSQTGAAKQRATRHQVRAALHRDHPLPVPPARSIARDGVRIVRAQAGCSDLAQSYLFDHTGLAAQLLRAGRRREATRMLLGAALFARRQPRSLAGLRLFRAR